MPAGHSVHTEAPDASEMEPAGQFEQLLTPPNEYLPAEQAVQALALPVENFPEGQDVQEPAPASEYSPALHALHRPNCAIEDLPASQTTQAFPPTEKYPGTHPTQPVASAFGALPSQHLWHRLGPIDTSPLRQGATWYGYARVFSWTIVKFATVLPASFKTKTFLSMVVGA